MSCSIRLEQLGDIGDQRIIGIGVRQERTNAQQDLGNGQRGGPLVLENVQADPSIGVDVTVIDARGEVHLGWLKGVVCREVNVEEKDPSGIRRIVRAHNGGLPMEHIVSNGSGRAVGRRILAKVYQFCGGEGWGENCSGIQHSVRGTTVFVPSNALLMAATTRTFVDSLERHFWFEKAVCVG